MSNPTTRHIGNKQKLPGLSRETNEELENQRPNQNKPYGRAVVDVWGLFDKSSLLKLKLDDLTSFSHSLGASVSNKIDRTHP